MAKVLKVQHLSAQMRRLTVLSVALLMIVIFCAEDARSKPGRRKAPGQQLGNARFVAGHSAVIPFEFEDNSIVIRVRVNGSRWLKFFFDTGAGMSVLSARQADRLGLKQADQVDVKGTGGTVDGSLTTGVALSTTGVRVLNQQLVVIPLDDFPCEARDIAGIIGYDFIKEFVVEIDYQARLIKLFDPGSYQYSRRGEQLPLTIKRTPRVQARIKLPGQEPIEGLFEIDTGSEGTLLVNSPFMNRHKLLDALHDQMPSNGRGVGGESRRIDARLDSLELGRFKISSPVISLSIATEGALAATDNDGPIGNTILRRFKVTLDYSRQRMWLEPNAHLSDPFETDMSGIEFDSQGKNCRVFKVTDVAEHSPAAEAGIKAADKIIRIDGRLARELTSSQLEQLLMQAGVEHTLILGRGGKVLTVRIKLRRLL